MLFDDRLQFDRLRPVIKDMSSDLLFVVMKIISRSLPAEKQKVYLEAAAKLKGKGRR
jgi:hypothetical protein